MSSVADRKTAPRLTAALLPSPRFFLVEGFGFRALGLRALGLEFYGGRGGVV